MLREARAALLTRSDLRGRALAVELAGVTDAWLRKVFVRACGEAVTDVALVAVGGYGRGELAPGSDLDLVLVHRNRADIGRVADAVWYPVWDSGVRLDHAVRNLREVGAAMDTDLRVALGWLDARSVAGSPALGSEAARAAADKWDARARRWLPALHDLVAERHEANGDLAFLLEPDLKESRGGLRDAHLLAALGRLGGASWSVGTGLEHAVGVLTDTRVELQRITGRASERLALQDQDAVAAALGTDADTLMADLADAGREVAWAADQAWRRVARAQRTSRQHLLVWVADPIEPGLVVRDGEVTLAYGADPANDPTLALRAAAASGELGLEMSVPLVDALARSATPEGRWPPDLLQALLRLLGAGRAAIPAWETLDHQGVIVGLLPEWAAVRNRPQRNAYHRFTVDRHLLETVANAATLTRRVSRPDLLLLGALLHDIGKGRGGDHTDAGVALVERLAPRIGLPPEDCRVVSSMVRHHLLLAEVATRRDIDDPATIDAVARAVVDRDTLALLAALSEADARATGPSAWTSWKAGLVAGLVTRVDAVLTGQPPPAPPPLSAEERRLLATGALGVALRGEHLSVVGPDRPDLLGAIAGVLTLSGVSVRSATLRAVSARPDEPAWALVGFEVAAARDVLPSAQRIEADLADALGGRLDLAGGIAEQRMRRPPRRPLAAHEGGEVTARLDHDASSSAVLLEVRAPDQPGTLWRVATAIAGSGLVISAARVATLGAEVVDTFYLRSPGGARPAEGDTRLDAALQGVLDALGSGAAFTDW